MGASTSSFFETKKPKIDPPLLIVGPCNSGKTALFYKLFTGGENLSETVSSVDENNTNGLMSTKFDPSVTLSCFDIPGHFNFRHRIDEICT